MAELGRTYQDGEVIIRQGEVGETMHVIQKGRVEIVVERDGREIQLRTAGPGEILGEMAVFDREVRSATVRAIGPVRALTVDGSTFLQRITEDPSLALRITRIMSRRIRALSDQLAERGAAG